MYLVRYARPGSKVTIISMKNPATTRRSTSSSLLWTVGTIGAALIAIASVSALIVGTDSRPLRLTVLLLASTAITVAVVLSKCQLRPGLVGERANCDGPSLARIMCGARGDD